MGTLVSWPREEATKGKRKIIICLLLQRWDPELARLAALNCRTCTFGHDACHNTDTFRQSGQSIGISSRSDAYEDPATVSKNIIDGWFNENTLGSMTNVNQFGTPTNGYDYLNQKQKSILYS